MAHLASLHPDERPCTRRSLRSDQLPCCLEHSLIHEGALTCQVTEMKEYLASCSVELLQHQEAIDSELRCST